MRYRVVMLLGTDSPYCPDKEHVADFYHRQHAIAFCDKLHVVSYVVDCFDDTTIYSNAR